MGGRPGGSAEDVLGRKYGGRPCRCVAQNSRGGVSARHLTRPPGGEFTACMARCNTPAGGGRVAQQRMPRSRGPPPDESWAAAGRTASRPARNGASRSAALPTQLSGRAGDVEQVLGAGSKRTLRSMTPAAQDARRSRFPTQHTSSRMGVSGVVQPWTACRNSSLARVASRGQGASATPCEGGVVPASAAGGPALRERRSVPSYPARRPR